MKKNVKNIFHYFIICLFMTTAFVVSANSPKALTIDYTNYYGIHMTNEEYLTLLNLGFTQNEIYYMTERIFEENRYADATLVSRTQKYYKTVYPTYGNSYTVEVTPSEYYNHSQQNELQSTVITEYKTLVSSVSANGNYYRYKATLSWNQLPNNKSYDVIGTGFTGHVHINGGITFYYTYTTADGSVTTSYNYFNKQYENTGGSTVFHLPSDFVGLSSTQYFNVAKDDNAGTITELHTCGDYAHSTTTVTGAEAASHGISIIGIDFVSTVINKFDEIPCAPSNINVNW